MHGLEVRSAEDSIKAYDLAGSRSILVNLGLYHPHSREIIRFITDRGEPFDKCTRTVHSKECKGKE